MATEPAVTPFGRRNTQAPSELDMFSFLVGKWKGTGKTALPDGTHAQFELTWIGRYILDGMAIADEIHSLAPDGSPYLGISLRHFGAKQDAWVIEYLNVSGSFIRRQVNAQSGSVSVAAGDIAIVSEDGPMRILENYRVADNNHFTYSTRMSPDSGQNWGDVLVEMTMTRVE